MFTSQRHESREGCEGRTAHRAPPQLLHVDFPAAEAGFRNPIHRGDRVCCVLFSSFQLQAVWHRAWSASSWYSYLTLLIFAHSWTAWETTAIWSYPVWKPPWDGQLTALSGLQWRHCVIWTAVEEDQRVKSKPELSHSGLRATEDGVAGNMFFPLSKLPLGFPLSLFCFY